MGHRTVGSRFSRSVWLVVVLATAMSLMPTIGAHSLERESASWAQVVKDLLAGYTGHTDVELQEFSSTSWKVGGETGLGWSGYADAGPAGGYMIAIVPSERVTVTAFRQEGDEIQQVFWHLSSDSPTASVEETEEVRFSQPNACEQAHLIAGGVTAFGCIFVTGTLASVACAAAGLAISASGTYGCEPDRNEKISASLDCDYTYCDISGHVFAYGYLSPREVSFSAFWDRDPEPGIIGTVPCYPACGVHSWTQHKLSAQHVQTILVVDENDPSRIRNLRVYEFSGRLWSSPACFRDTTKAVSINMHTSYPSANGTKNIYGRVNSGSKPWRFCDY